MILLAMALAGQGLELTPDSRFDFRCAETAAWAMTWIGKGDLPGKTSDNTWKVMNLEAFYLGRLSAREPTRNWLKTVIADMYSNGLAEKVYSDAIKDCRTSMDAVMTGTAP